MTPCRPHPCVLALAAGCALALPLAAQTQSEVPTLPIGPRIAPFTDRAIVPVYNAIYDECASSPFAIGNGSSYVMEDVSFQPGPWGNTYTGPRDIVQVDGMFQSAGWTGTPTMRITQLFEFYEPGNFTTAPMLSNTVAIAVRAVPTNFGSGYAWNYTSDPFTSPVALGTRVNVWVAIKATDPLTGYRIADGNTGLIQPVGQTAVNYGVWLGRAGHPCVGDTSVEYARDMFVNGPTGSAADFNGCPYPQQCDPIPCTQGCENRRTAFDFTAGARVLTLGLRGEVIPQDCDGIDFNNDTLFPDTLDLSDFLSVFAGGPCSNDPLCGDIDFNNDGLFPDTLDINALLSVFSGGPCLF